MMASASTSSMSIQKSASTNVSQNSEKNPQGRKKSCDTVCSSNSSCFLKRRQPVHPLAGSVRPYGTRSSGNVVKQRVMSAKLLKLRSIQSELNDANFHLVELAKENRALKTLQRRQDKALLNYEGVNAELPRLIKSHEDEIRVLHEKNKALRKHLKDISEQLKFKDEELVHVKEQLKRLSSLTKDKNLPEREKLMEQVEELKESLNKSETQISLLNRKLMLEAKNAKFKVNNEAQKFKQSQKDLNQALSEVDRLSALLDARSKLPPGNVRRRFPNTNSISLVALGSSSSTTINHHRSSSGSMTDVKEESVDTKSESNTSEGKFEPIMPNISQEASREEMKVRESRSQENRLYENRMQENRLQENRLQENRLQENRLQEIRSQENRLEESRSQEGRLKESQSREDLNGILKSPLDNVKARLSANSKRYQNLDLDETKYKFEDSKYKLEDSKYKLEDIKYKLEDTKYKLDDTQKNHIFQKSRPNSSQKLEKLTNSLQKISASADNEIDQSLGLYCGEIVNSVRTSNKQVNKHNDSLETAKFATSAILAKLQETDEIDKKLRSNKLLENRLLDGILGEKYGESKHERIVQSKSIDNGGLEDTFLDNLLAEKRLVGSKSLESKSREKKMEERASKERTSEERTSQQRTSNQKTTEGTEEINHNSKSEDNVSEETIFGKPKENNLLKTSLLNSKFLSKEEIEIPERDLDLVNQIWKDEYSYQKTANRSPRTIEKYDYLSRSTEKNGTNNGHNRDQYNDLKRDPKGGHKRDKNGNVTATNEPEVPLEDKRKLLATLRAIDNGDTVESENEVPVVLDDKKRNLLASLRAIDNGDGGENFSDNSSSSNRRLNIMNELFGNI